VNEEQKDDLSLILAASLTLLALIIGFSFSMASNRYDQPKSFEEAESQFDRNGTLARRPSAIG
jgi:hypothetical protein